MRQDCFNEAPKDSHLEVVYIVIARHVIALLALVIRQAVALQRGQADVLIIIHISVQVPVQPPCCWHEGLVIHPLCHLAIVRLHDGSL